MINLPNGFQISNDKFDVSFADYKSNCLPIALFQNWTRPIMMQLIRHIIAKKELRSNCNG